MVSDIGSMSYLMKMPVWRRMSSTCSLALVCEFTWHSLPVLRHTRHVSHRVLTRVEDATTSVDVSGRDHADEVLEDVEICTVGEWSAVRCVYCCSDTDEHLSSHCDQKKRSVRSAWR